MNPNLYTIIPPLREDCGLVRDTGKESESLAARLARLGVTVELIDHAARRKMRGNRFANLDTLGKNLLDLKTVLDRHNIIFFLAQGTLLAAARDGRFFDHSIDCDLYAYWSHRYRLAIAVADLIPLGFRVTKLIEKPRFKKITFDRDGEWMDINFLVPRGRGPFRYWSTRRTRYPAKSFDKGEPIRFLDSTFFAPRNFRGYLKRRYGSGWSATVYKLGNPDSFDRIRDTLEIDDVRVALPYPFWPLGICQYHPVSVTKLQQGPGKGMIVLYASGNRICLRYVREARMDGSVKVHGTDDRTISTWWPANTVLAQATRLHFKSGVTAPLDGWAMRWVFRSCSALAAGWMRCVYAFRLTR